MGQRVWRQLCTRKAARIAAAGLTLVLYVKFRSFLAVDQLVRIYREVMRSPVNLPAARAICSTHFITPPMHAPMRALSHSDQCLPGREYRYLFAPFDAHNGRYQGVQQGDAPLLADRACRGLMRLAC